MSSLEGYKFTDGRKAAPARKRFTDPQAIYSVYDALKTEDVKDAERRAKIRAVYDGALPYATEQLRAKGLAHMTNLNFHGMSNTIDARADAIIKLATDTCDLVELEPISAEQAGPDVERIGAVISEEFSKILRAGGHTIPALSTMSRESDLYGLGPITWPNDDAFEPVAMERGQVKFRGDGPAVSSDHDLFMFESELPASYVFALLDSPPEVAEEAGWNLSVLKRLIVSVYADHNSSENDPSSQNGLAPVETALMRIRSNTFFETHQFDKFEVLHVYVREMKYPQTITHIIVPGRDRTENKFLFYKEDAYQTMDQCLIWFPYKTSERFARAIRGLASSLVPIERMSDRLTGAIIDSAFRASRQTLQQKNPGATPAVSLAESGTSTIIAAGLDPVPSQNAAANLQALTTVRQFISQVGTGAVAGTDLAPVSTGIKISQGGDQPSKAEAEIQERRRTLRDENLCHQRLLVLDKVFAECFRRFMNRVRQPMVIRGQDNLVMEFIEGCARRQVPYEVLIQSEPFFRVVTNRELVLGADGKYALLSQLLQLTAGNLDEQGRKSIVHDMYRLRLGRRAADKYCPLESRDTTASSEASYATLENNAIKALTPTLVTSDQWHWSHIPVHAQVLQEVQQAVQRGLAEAQTVEAQGGQVQQNQQGEIAPQVDDPQRLAQVLEAASQHIQQHLQFGEANIGKKEAAEQIRQMLRDLAPTIKALNLAIATQRRVQEAEAERQQRQLEALEKQASEAEMQKALAKVQADKEVGLARVQADKEIGMAKVESERELNAGKLQNDREHRAGQLSIETEAARARAGNEAASTRAAIENRRAETDASIETARQTAMADADIRRQTAAQTSFENSRRFNNVTGRETVSPAQVMNPNVTPGPGYEGELPL